MTEPRKHSYDETRQFTPSQLDELVESCEQAWSRGERPNIEKALDTADASVDRLRLLVELVHLELEHRLAAGEPARVEEYLTRYPQLEQDRQVIVGLIRSEYEMRRQQEQGVHQSEYERRFPWCRDLRLLEPTDLRQEHLARAAVHLNCPHCQNPIEIVAAAAEEVLCPSCGSSFQLDDDQTRTWTKDHGMPQLGRFELIEAVGRGAFGTVYRARDKQLQRIVAVKVPRSGQLCTSDDEDRFVREARNAAQLKHSGIVPVFETGRSDTFPYIVSEFVEGVTLADALTARKFSFRKAAELVAQIAEALEHAHSQGVVHRDLKPSNIMLTSDDAPRVMDFGLAKRDAGEITVTIDGQVLGTPAYMSPEQARGEAHSVDGRSDVYSLGVILYELLTGELPFRGNQRMLLHQVIYDEPRSARWLNDRIPRDLDTICAKAMLKEASRRYQSARALADDLRSYLSSQPIAARPVGRLERTWRWCRRKPLVAGLSAAVILALSGGTIVSTYFAIHAQQRLEEATAERARADQKTQEAVKSERLARAAEARADKEAAAAIESAKEAADAGKQAKNGADRAKREADKSRQVAKFLAGMFESSAPRKYAGFRFSTAKNGDADATVLASRALLDRGSRKVLDELSDQPDVQASLLDTIGSVYIGLGMTEQAEPLLIRALQTRRELPDAKLEVAQSLYSLSILRSMQFQLGEAAAAARESLTIRRSLLGDEHQETVDSKFMLAFSLGWSDQRYEPEALLAEVVKWRREHFGKDHPETAFAMIGLGGTLIHRGAVEEAAPILMAAANAFKKNPETRLVGLAMTEVQQARILWNLRQYKPAADLTTKAVQHFRDFQGDEHPLFLFVASLHMKSLKNAGRMPEAKQFYRDLIERIRGKGQIGTGIIDLIATFLLNSDDPIDLQEAEQLCRDERVRSAERPRMSADAELAFTLARVILEQSAQKGELKYSDEATRLCQEGIAIRREIGMSPTFSEVNLLHRVTDPLWATRPDTAERMLSDAIAMTSTALETDRARTQRPVEVDAYANAVLHLGGKLKSLGKSEDARTLFEEALPRTRLHRDEFFSMRLCEELGTLSREKKDHLEAERHYRESIALCEALIIKNKMMGGWLGHLRMQLAGLFAEHNKVDQAIEQYKAVVASGNRLWSQSAIPAWIALAVRNGKPEDDEQVYRESLALLAELAIGETAKDTSDRPYVELYKLTAVTYGRLLRERGKFTVAEEVYPEALQLVRQRGHDRFAIDLTIGYAKLRTAQQKVAEAETLFHDAVTLAAAEAVREKATGDPMMSDALCELAGFFVSVGKRADAEKTYGRVIDLGVPAGIIQAQQRLLAMRQNITWNVRYYLWPNAGTRQPPEDWESVVASKALATSQVEFIDFAWWMDPPHNNVPGDHFAVVATTQIEAPAGKLAIHTLSDDGVRVSIDGKRLIDHWDWHEMAHDSTEVEVAAGRHEVQIEYFDIDGLAILKCSLLPIAVVTTVPLP